MCIALRKIISPVPPSRFLTLRSSARPRPARFVDHFSFNHFIVRRPNVTCGYNVGRSGAYELAFGKRSRLDAKSTDS